MSGLRGFINSLSHPDHHLEAWEFVNNRVSSYPNDINIKPYRKPRVPEIAKGLFTVQLARTGQLTAAGGGAILTTCSGDQVDTEIMPAGGEAFPQLKRQLLSDKKRGKLQVFAQGTAAEFRQLLDLYGRSLLAQGYQVHVLGSLSRIVALKVTKSNRTWWLCDAEAVTGVDLPTINAQIRDSDGITSKSGGWCQALHRVLSELQRELVTRFGVSLHPTIAQSAAKAAAAYIPEGVWLWRPSPTLTAMCRAGGGFRGGYANACDYDGPGWKMDVRRQYTAALRVELPYAVSFGPWHETGWMSNGLFMCTVRGPGKMRVLLNVWKPREKKFELQRWNSKECVCILPTSEIEGLAALGYLVLPGYGFAFNRTFNFKPFVQRLQVLTDIHGPKSIIGIMCKSLGSKVWGKWAQSPERVEVAYSEERPADDWSPMCNGVGDEIESLWTSQRTTYNSLQHIDLATVITAAARSQVYSKAAELLDAGARLAQVVTDSIIVQGLPPPAPPPLDAPIGAWYYEGWAPHVSVRSTGANTWGDVARRPGVKGATVAEVRSIGYQDAPPEGEAPVKVGALRYVR